MFVGGADWCKTVRRRSRSKHYRDDFALATYLRARPCAYQYNIIADLAAGPCNCVLDEYGTSRVQDNFAGPVWRWEDKLLLSVARWGFLGILREYCEPRRRIHDVQDYGERRRG